MKYIEGMCTFCSFLAVRGISVLPRHTSGWENVVDRQFLIKDSLQLQPRV